MTLALDWREMFFPSIPILEIVIRGSVTYLGVIVLLRFVLKRESGALSLTDVLMVVLLGDASQNAMAHDHQSIADGILLVSTILFWNYSLDWLGYRFLIFERFINPPPLPLVKNGKMLWKNMRRELITETELMSQVRAAGIQDVGDVRLAVMESDGHISVISKDQGDQKAKKKQERSPL
jgi:uncharacterized membrane protein YcaP (DUF421 family)